MRNRQTVSPSKKRQLFGHRRVGTTFNFWLLRLRIEFQPVGEGVISVPRSLSMGRFFAVRSLSQQRGASRAVSLVFFVETVCASFPLFLETREGCSPTKQFLHNSCGTRRQQFLLIAGSLCQATLHRQKTWSRDHILLSSRNSIHALGGEKSNSASSCLDQQFFVSELRKTRCDFDDERLISSVRTREENVPRPPLQRVRAHEVVFTKVPDTKLPKKLFLIRNFRVP